MHFLFISHNKAAFLLQSTILIWIVCEGTGFKYHSPITHTSATPPATENSKLSNSLDLRPGGRLDDLMNAGMKARGWEAASDHKHS